MHKKHKLFLWPPAINGRRQRKLWQAWHNQRRNSKWLTVERKLLARWKLMTEDEHYSY